MVSEEGSVFLREHPPFATYIYLQPCSQALTRKICTLSQNSTEDTMPQRVDERDEEAPADGGRERRAAATGGGGRGGDRRRPKPYRGGPRRRPRAAAAAAAAERPAVPPRRRRPEGRWDGLGMAKVLLSPKKSKYCKSYLVFLCRSW